MTKKKAENKIRIAAVGDLHFRKNGKEKWAVHFREAANIADILLLCGDLTDTGIPEEADELIEALKNCSIPVVAVFGNHDYEKEQQEELKNMLSREKIYLLDGESVIIKGIGFAGIKGFGGGFDQYMLPSWGEKIHKLYVQEVVNEALKLDRALANLDIKHLKDLKKIVLMHYAPIKGTIKGEPEVIYPFLGSSRLAEPIDRRNVTAVFHGHAHYGMLEGKTAGGIRVFNVSRPLLKKKGYDPPFYVLEV